jgi:hypothetical protein
VRKQAETFAPSSRQRFLIRRSNLHLVLRRRRNEVPETADSNGQTIWIADAHRDNGKRFVARIADSCSCFRSAREDLALLADFIAERPQPMRAPDISFFVELLALIICPVGLLLFAISLVLFIRSGRPTAPRG